MSTNSSAVTGHISQSVSRDIISTNGRSVSGHMAPSVILCIYEFLYNFDTVLYQFLETRTLDIIKIGRDQLLIILGFVQSLHNFLTLINCVNTV